MFHRISLALAFALALCAFSQDSAMPDTPWFDHVTRPTSASHEELCALAASLHKALKEKKSASKIAELAPADPAPRVLFVTIGTDKWPGRTYFGTGMTFREALQNVAAIITSNEPAYAEESAKSARAMIAELSKEGRKVPEEWRERLARPGDWSWLKLDVVQIAKPCFGYTIGHSRIALTSLVGFAFGPEMGYAFTPDQIVGRQLLNSSGHVAKHQVVNIISENYNWPALRQWMKLCAMDRGQRICLFETDSYYTDGNEACRLYRGHRLEDKAPDAAQALQMAADCAEKIAAATSPDGRIKAPVPEWESTGKDDECPDAKAEFALALCRLAESSGRPEFSAQALALMAPVVASIKKFGDGRMAVVEDEMIPEDSMRSSEKVCMLRTNALACLALLALRSCGKDVAGGIDNIIRALALNLKDQHVAGCEFYGGRYWKTGAVVDDDYEGSFADVNDASLAALAMARAAEAMVMDELAAENSKIIEALAENKVSKVPMETVKCSPWLAEALGELKSQDKGYLLSLVKLAYSVSTRTEVSPLYPDYYGAMRKRPGCTMAAERSWLLLAISRRMREMGKPTLAEEQLREAQASVMFQVQARIDKAGSCFLPVPSYYVSLFRDNLENCGFTLPGQSAQIMALCAYADELRQCPGLDSRKFYNRLAEVRRNTDVHPGPLEVDLILTSDDVDDEERSLFGGFSESGKTRIKTKAGRLENSSGGVDVSVRKNGNVNGKGKGKGKGK